MNIIDQTSIEKKSNNDGVFFSIENNSRNNLKNSYSVLIPSPNITGPIHIGHGLNMTIQDVIVRWKKINKQKTFWPPGLDHGGIATQHTVEKYYEKNQNIKRLDLGKEKFLQLLDTWKDKKSDEIHTGMHKLGLALSWEYQWYTMDISRNDTVQSVFIELYNRGFVYRDEGIVNWCPNCRTALSDMEVNLEAIDSNLYDLKLEIVDSQQEDNSDKKYLLAKTLRPELLLGCSAVCISNTHPDSETLSRKKVRLPIINTVVPLIIVDELNTHYNDSASIVCPSHSSRDYDIAKQHGLPITEIFTDACKINHEGEFNNLLIDECRNKIIEILEKNNLLIVSKNVEYGRAKCYRCSSIVQPKLKKQWFIKMRELAQPAISAVKEGKIKFNNDHWKEGFLQWMERIVKPVDKRENWWEGACLGVTLGYSSSKDWVISRQIWWGHPIPIYFCKKCSHIHVSSKVPNHCEKCECDELVQESDVLDMWFSCATWPLSVVEWPRKKDMFKHLFPFDLTVIGHDVLYFWVTATNMISLELVNEVSFKNVYVHGLVCDENGKKMTKSLGNTINVEDVVDKYGVDSFRDSIIKIVLSSQDKENLPFDSKSIALSKIKIEKLKEWLLASILGFDKSVNKSNNKHINQQLDLVKIDVDNELSSLNIAEAMNLLNDRVNFIFNNKIKYPTKNQLEYLLKLFHPFYPELTEHIWMYELENESSIIDV